MNKKILVTLLSLCLVCLVVCYAFTKVTTHEVVRTSNTNQTISSNEYKTFKSSSAMKFSIQYPSKYQVVEKFGTTTLTTSEGEIIVGQNGTNFSSLDEYLSDFSKKNSLIITNGSNVSINGMETRITDINGNKYYFIFAPDKVYSLYTTSKNLYSDLDQIAQSFKYTP